MSRSQFPRAREARPVSNRKSLSQNFLAMRDWGAGPGAVAD